MLEEYDAPRIEVAGSVIVGTLDPATAQFSVDPAGGTLRLDVTTTAEADDGPAQLTTMLVDADGTVAFWSDPARQLPQVEPDDDVRTAPTGTLYDAVDCRTGLPLTGTYQAFVHDAGGPETVELAPVTFDQDATRPAVDTSVGPPQGTPSAPAP
jgi:hypothetical protein